MFSNSNHISNKTYKKTNQANQYINQLQEHTPYSPQTKPYILPLNSYKSFLSGSPNSANQLKQNYIIKLTQLIEPQNQVGISSKIIVLVSSNQGSLHFHDQAANVLQRYPNNDIAFVGIWGAENSDKSFFYDRVLSLCDITGDKYTAAAMVPDSNAQLYFYQRPFIKDKSRFFLINSRGYKNANSLTKTQKYQLDILLSLCQVIILIQDSNTTTDIIDISHKHINQSFHRLYIDKKKKQQQITQICWPKSLFILYNTQQSIKKHKKSQQKQKQLCNMFKDYNFSILHNNNNNNKYSQQLIKTYTTINNQLDQLYLKNTFTIFKQIYNKIQSKNYLNIQYNGITCPHILAQIIYTINQHNNLYLPRTFNKAKRSIYSSIYNRFSLAYLLKMKQYIKQQKPYSTQYLLYAFNNVNNQIMQQYYQVQNQISIKPNQDSLNLQYQNKLQEYIEEKQKNILAVNYKKSMKLLNNLLSQNNNNSNHAIEELKKMQNSIFLQNKERQRQRQRQRWGEQQMIENKRSYDYNAESIFVGNSIKSIYAKNVAKSYQSPIVANSIQEQSEKQEQIQLSKQQQQQQEQPLQLNPIYQQYQKQLLYKKQVLQRKKQQLYKLQQAAIVIPIQQTKNQALPKQMMKYKQQQKQLQIQIKNQQQKIKSLKQQVKVISNLGSNGSQQIFINQAKNQVEELRRKVSEIRYEKQMVEKNMVVEKEPQVQMLQSKLMAKKKEFQQVKKSGVKMPTAQVPGGPGAEKRVISSKTANIRRVHASKI